MRVRLSHLFYTLLGELQLHRLRDCRHLNQMPERSKQEEEYLEIGELPEMLNLALGVHDFLTSGGEKRVFLNDIEVSDSLTVISDLWSALKVCEENSGGDQM